MTQRIGKQWEKATPKDSAEIRSNSVGADQWQEAKLEVVVASVLWGWWPCDGASEPCPRRVRHRDVPSRSDACNRRDEPIRSCNGSIALWDSGPFADAARCLAAGHNLRCISSSSIVVLRPRKPKCTHQSTHLQHVAAN